MLRIDAHHHLWRYNAAEYSWLTGSLAVLRQDFLPADLDREAHAAGVSATVVVQARETLAETDWLLQQAAKTPRIAGVVGWLPLCDPHLPALLEAYRRHALLKGLRHIVQAEPAGFLDRSDFNAGIRALEGTGLAYDLLVRASQLAEATRFVDRHPHQLFVLNHLGKPPIASGALEPWASKLRELARRPHVLCKLSGMVTEADPAGWSAAQLKPFFEVALEAFTPSRLMAGSDWPVLTAQSSYGAWWDLLATWISALSAAEQDAILATTAERAYMLTGLRE